MNTFLLSLLALPAVITIASIGIINAGRSLTGSCEETDAAHGEKNDACSMCSDDKNRCSDQIF